MANKMKCLTRRLTLAGVAAATLWLSGCAVVAEMPVARLQLDSAGETRVGEAVTPRLLQLLGGPYHDRQLASDLKRLAARNGSGLVEVVVADRSEQALYALPGNRLILTRGLLAGVRNGEELNALLVRGRNSYPGGMTRTMAGAVRELEGRKSDPLDPDAAEIRLAAGFAERPCDGYCLTGLLAGPAGRADLPKTVARLAELRPGYDTLARAQEIEAAGDSSRAIALLLQAAGETPDEPRLLGSLGLAYLRAGQLQPARLHLQKSVKLQPNYYRTQMGLGFLYLQTTRLDEARRALEASAALLPVTENLFLLGETHEKSGNPGRAKEYYRRVVQHDSTGKLGREARARLARLGER